MIQNEGKYYMYRHIRLDKNEPFYVGIGTKEDYHLSSPTPSFSHKRAYSKVGRNTIWKRIVAKTNYEVEIILESDDYEFVKQKEIEFIALYKRRDCCGGCLVNLTDGGEGTVGYIHSQEQRDAVSNRFKNRIGDKHQRSKEVFVYSVEGDFIGKYPSRRQCALSLGMDRGCIDQNVAGKITQCFGYVFKEEYLGEDIGFTKKPGTKAVEVLDRHSLEVLHSFSSVTKTAAFLNSSTSQVSGACKNTNKIVKGFKVRYKDE